MGIKNQNNYGALGLFYQICLDCFSILNLGRFLTNYEGVQQKFILGFVKKIKLIDILFGCFTTIREFGISRSDNMGILDNIDLYNWPKPKYIVGLTV